MESLSSVTHELETLRDFVRWGASSFNKEGLVFGHGSDNAIDEAIWLVLHAVHLQPGLPESLWKSRLTAPEKEIIADLFKARIEKRLPAAYLTHKAWFAGFEFYIDERALIPRSPIAELIENGFEPWLRPDEINDVLDMCTGSGCIAAACALLLPDAQVDAADVSKPALEVAQRNVIKHHLQDQVRLIHSNLFDCLERKHYDLIIANPPYVDDLTFSRLPPEYRHEPAVGLSAGEDGLDYVHRILAAASAYLAPQGALIVEVGTSRSALEKQYPEINFVWLDLQRGGEGVFLLTAAQLHHYAALFHHPLT